MKRPKHSPKSTLPVPPEWETIIERYLLQLRASGYSKNTLITRRHHLHFLARRINLGPLEVTQTELVEWCALQDWSSQSRRARNITYRLFWRWCEQNDIMPDISGALPNIRQKHRVARPTPESAYTKALKAADPPTQLILRLAAECGLRRDEICQVHTSDLVQDFVGWSLIVHGKGDKERLVPLPAGLAVVLRACPEGYIFPGNDNGHWGATWVGRLATRALPEEWTLHTLRARFATLTYEVDRDVFAVQELLGHASSETTRRYVRTNADRLRRLVDAAAQGYSSISRESVNSHEPATVRLSRQHVHH